MTRSHTLTRAGRASIFSVKAPVQVTGDIPATFGLYRFASSFAGYETSRGALHN